MSEEYESLLASVSSRCDAAGQSHILAHLPTLASLDERLALLRAVDDVPVEMLATYLRGALDEEERLKNFDPANAGGDDAIEPFAGETMSTTIIADDDPTQRAVLDESRRLGMSAIADGQVAAVLLAGGQGTRLGYDGPKGVYDIGLPSRSTLFQYMAERIIKLGRLSGAGPKAVPFYIMTSPLNHDATVAYFNERSKEFGNNIIDVRFFPQGTLPALTHDGKMILETPTSLAVAPDGNGGIYPALVKHGILDDMKNRGIKAKLCKKSQSKNLSKKIRKVDFLIFFRFPATSRGIIVLPTYVVTTDVITIDALTFFAKVFITKLFIVT